MVFFFLFYLTPFFTCKASANLPTTLPMKHGEETQADHLLAVICRSLPEPSSRLGPYSLCNSVLLLVTSSSSDLTPGVPSLGKRPFPLLLSDRIGASSCTQHLRLTFAAVTAV